ncbi:MAG: pitrilysin family protein [Bacteroidales bacterium]|nr:pitrilysin family protein [Bacteroidales bacterium]
MEIITTQLDSGIGYAFRRISSPVAYCALSIKAGTRDEEPVLNGIAHLTEHMLFKGTATKGSRRINNFLESLGGELNAYTTKEETVIHATVLKEDISKAVELLSDLAFNSLYPEKELLKERDIVLDEICSYKDSPSEQIFDDFDEYLFGKHPLSMPILGKPKSVKQIGVDNIKRFTGTYYLPSNMSFAIVADITPERGAQLVERYFGKKENNGKAPNGIERCVERDISALPAERIKRVSRKTHQAHCVMGVSAYSLYNEKRMALALLSNILGGPALNSRLNHSLREKHALAYTVDSSFTPYTDTGLFTIYFGTDKNSIERCLDIVYKELDVLKNKELSPASLKAAKKQLLGQLAISTDNAESQCLSMGKSLLFYGKVEPIESIMERISAIDSQRLNMVAKEILDPERMFTLIYS